ncbi:MAG: SEL1-like repeat protein, partial [Deltaproteobacteria bacterium]|nr:SEL1-like repeat protein [Deltaproteobacteria bacterium]
ADAQRIVAEAYDRGEGLEQDLAKAMRWYQAAGEQGDLEAIRRVAELGVRASEGDELDLDQAASLYRLAAEAGDPEAQWKLGQMLEEGEGIRMARAEAVEWYRKATASGHPAARRHLAAILDRGRFVRRDIEQAMVLYEAEAKDGNVEAAARLGEIYWEGRDVTRDRKLAMKWHRQAAEAGHTASELFVGVRYFEGGYGLRKQPADAYRFLTAAAAAEDDVADFFVGRCLWEGVGVEKNMREAVVHFRRGIERGSIESFRYLGLAAVLGASDSKNPVRDAYLMFAIGAAFNDGDSASELRAMRKQLEKSDIDRFDARVAKQVASYNEKWREYSRQSAREKKKG